MTIFDIRPYSFWRDLHRASYHGWAHLGKDTPRSVCELYLLRAVNSRLRYELSCVLAQLDATNQRRGEEWYRMNERHTKVCDLAAERGRQLQWALLAIKMGTVPNPPISSETPIASINTPASGETCEIGGVACATMNGGNNV